MKLNPPNTTTPRIKELTLRLNEAEGGLRLTTLAGRIIVLFVFGIDCGTCRHLAGMLSEIRKEYAPAAEFIGVCVQSGCGEKLEAFREQSGATLPLAACSTRELCPALGISPATWLFYPTFIFIDPEQRMRGFVVGGSEFFEDVETNLPAAVEGLLSEKNPAWQVIEKVEVGA
jgi:thiol-disulfide isomerase/thioredoxin